MKRSRPPKKIVKVHCLLTLLLTLILAPACGFSGWVIEYDEPDQDYIGRTIRFKVPVKYLYCPDSESKKDWNLNVLKFEGKQIERVVIEFDTVFRDNDKWFPIPADMEFTIMGSYWNKRTGVFKHDIHNVILKDENGIISICNTRSLELDTDFKR